jgi:hypothetical protein
VAPKQMEFANDFIKPFFKNFIKSLFVEKFILLWNELQIDLDHWINDYNYERTHQGKMCCGRTPFQTLLAGKEDWI